MRAVLIVNPNATSTTPAGRDLLAHALESRTRLTVAHTGHRGHAIEIAQQAVEDNIDVVIAHGGDGTVNEVVNGLLGKPGRLPLGQLPAVAVVPGGSANVFARSLGIPADPVEATNLLVDLIDAHVAAGGGDWRRVGLMDCGERWGVFTAGMGVDGEIVAAVEAHRKDRQKGVSAGRYIRVAVPALLRSTRREPQLTLHLPDREPISGVHFAFVSNSSPWTFANARPIYTNPDCRFETGLGVFATTSMSAWRNLWLARRMWSKRADIKGPHLIRDDDVASVKITAATPIAAQIDGDYIGERESMTFVSVPRALSVVAPPPQPTDQR
ncbi:diacylglycerol/lipid kinase family protein [Mycolicibacterium fallax]|uniref:Diacylglycerol kinase n=1 Tax=Mycolicibacterium fallax TaxID=1793 RepID=A0A1X1REZ9_MYCFA|nr:diacylglycerol kinase family protein [Mycolicibacterium fallax]ORV04237.1 diacylglycerol kinase [Mycolicibacterium fallax]BBY98410.1 diacylglycerol kinase [Mycolicibacterium fallax]